MEKQTTRSLLFGKYELGRLLGQGTFAKVYYAKHLKTGEGVAIKALSKDQIKKEGLINQIKREISVMRLVRHPNIVQLKEVLATKTKIYFVMEYVKGGELFAKVAKGRLKEEAVRSYFQQLISAIDLCHSRGIAHRDLKPENLLLDEHENLKVSDFGLSALPEQLRQDGLLHTQCGTPAYVAPEVLRKKGYDGAKADIWSCGVILYVLLAGFLPFQDENIMTMYRKVFKGEFEFPPWFSTEAKTLISKLLVTDPEKRITIGEIVENSWFKKGLSRPNFWTIEPPEQEPEETEKLPFETEEPDKPAFFNAFELISSMSLGFDLSNLFENKRKSGTMFTSKHGASSILRKLETIAKGLGFCVKRKGFKVWINKEKEGRKGPLHVKAEVFEVAPSLAVVEFSKSSGDTLEYAEFFERQVRPGLGDIVWTWQGDEAHAVA
ncbi:hypothetical protein AMTRI_Chr12g239450 [Amborella trichopoda]|uniref:non-specific serine/threonine protein kinase n=1 Tax=Amborella trichopoda TaxID=13333 RepID=U5DB70_AMBTC|nr:CBL-interacting serine/threonine-protein kinase 25 [Amborella trichopoda]ERN18667.1 hypothetical protein AMTR_s00065p00195610 [Amborella trichopoda]|eukprot:XP_006857200.1 CBL-interacting serine/threonine-protein kinase 25 [Amborella trichopoda]